MWAIGLHAVWGAPGALHGPWPIERLMALKKSELETYWLTVLGLPLFSTGIGWTLRQKIKTLAVPLFKDAPTVERSTAHWLFLGILLPAAVYGELCHHAAARAIEWMDDGLRLAAVSQVEHGRRVYREIYLNYGPIYEVLLPRFALRLFGPSADSLVRFDNLWNPVNALLIYLFCFVARVRPAAPCLLAISFFTGNVLPLVPRNIAWLAALVCLAVPDDESPTRRKELWGAAGFFLGLAFLLSSETGILGFASAVLYTGLLAANERSRSVVWSGVSMRMNSLVLGAGGVMFPFGLWLMATGRFSSCFGNMRDALIATPVLIGKPTPPLYQPAIQFLRQPWGFFTFQQAVFRWWAPLVLYIGTLAWASTRVATGALRPKDRPLALTACAGVLFFTVAMGRCDQDHWVKASAPLWMLRVLLLNACLETAFWVGARRSSFSGWMKRIGAAFGGLILIRYMVGPLNVWALVDEWRPLHSSRQEETIRYPRWGEWPASAQDRERLRDLITPLRERTQPGDRLFILTDDALAYFLTETVNPTPFDVAGYVFTEPNGRRAVNALEKEPPRWVVTLAGRDEIAAGPGQEPIAAYIKAHYALESRHGKYLFFVRRPVGTEPIKESGRPL